MIYQDLKPLIALLSKASVSNYQHEQALIIEQELVSIELIGECYDFVEILQSLKFLQKVNLENRTWNEDLFMDLNPDKDFR